jgi:death-on-curing family protein
LAVDASSWQHLPVRTKRVSVAQLAAEAGVDVEEVLIRIWDVGLDGVQGPIDVLGGAEAGRVRRLLGLPSSHEISRPQYWLRALGLDALAMEDLLRANGLTWSPAVKTLPKGAVRVLKRHARGASLLDTPPVVAPVPDIPSVPAAPAFTWKDVGNVEVHKFLAVEQVERIHWALAEDLVGDVDPIVPAGIRDSDLLASAIHRQHTASGATVKYPTAVMAAAALLHSLVLNHPFHNGNKRTGLVSMLVLLDENGLMLTCDQDVLFQVVLRLAAHELVPREWLETADREVMWLAEWMDSNSRRVEKGERAVQWRKLKQILADFNCQWEFAPGAGNKLNIHRDVQVLARFGRRRRRELHVQVKFTDDGREAMKHTIHQIRTRLELDEDHGVDSASFYGDAGRSLDDFILRYRKTLSRLAQL